MKMHDYEIALATPADLQKIVALNLLDSKVSDATNLNIEKWFELGNWQGSEELIQWHFRQIRNAAGDIFLAITSSGELVGEIEYVVEKVSKPARCHIFWLFVAPAYRRKGIAKQLIARLAKEANMPIWVESEDARSDRLYSKLGMKIRILRNFTLDLSNRNFTAKNSPVLKRSSLTEVHSGLNKLVRIIGQYNIPSLDILQLINSRQTIIEQIIWGEDTPDVYRTSEGSSEFYIILTQYLRMYSIDGALPSKELLEEIIFRAAKKEYFNLKVQVYDDKRLITLLTQLDFKEEKETNDPIYKLN